MSAFYNSFLDIRGGAGPHPFIHIIDDDIKVGIISAADYTFNAAHQDWDDVGTYGLNTSYNSEPNPSLLNRTFDSASLVFDNTADISFSSVAADGTKTITSVIHYKNSGIISTSPLICQHTGFTPITPNGSDITVVYNTAGIFRV